MVDKVQVCVIGAGPSGIAAAKKTGIDIGKPPQGIKSRYKTYSD
jgi:hypothetical protein